MLCEDLFFKELPSKPRREMQRDQTNREGAAGILFVLTSLVIKERKGL